MLDTLYVFVEGNDDEKFVTHIIEPLIMKKIPNVQIIKWCTRQTSVISNMIKAISSLSNADYFFLADMDTSTCITQRKLYLCSRFLGLDESHIIIVVKEIESWYLAGLDGKTCKKLKITYYACTQGIGKEAFNRIIPKRHKPRSHFLTEILKYYHFDTAVSKNTSLRYFYTKHLTSYLSF